MACLGVGCEPTFAEIFDNDATLTADERTGVLCEAKMELVEFSNPEYFLDKRSRERSF